MPDVKPEEGEMPADQEAHGHGEAADQEAHGHGEEPGDADGWCWCPTWRRYIHCATKVPGVAPVSLSHSLRTHTPIVSLLHSD